MEPLVKKKQPSRFARARDAITGRFITIIEAIRRPTTTIIEKLKRRGKNG